MTLAQPFWTRAPTLERPMTADRVPFPERLAAARQVVAHVEANYDELAEAIPTWWLDQVQAAVAEAHTNLLALAPLLRELEPDRWRDATPIHDEPTAEQTALLLAALYGCSPCWHLRSRDQPGPLLADLNHRLVLCRRCCRTHRRVVHDDRCEICDGPVPDRRFESFVIACAAVTYVGNAGDCCAPALLIRTDPDQSQ